MNVQKIKPTVLFIVIFHTFLVTPLTCPCFKQLLSYFVQPKQPIYTIQREQKTLKIRYKKDLMLQYFEQGAIQKIVSAIEKCKYPINKPITVSSIQRYEGLEKLTLLDLADFFYRENPYNYQYYKEAKLNAQPLYDFLKSRGAQHSEMYKFRKTLLNMTDSF